MNRSRRELLAALGAAWLVASAGALPALTWLGHERTEPGAWPAPAGDDQAAFTLGRLGFGARPRDRERFTDSGAWLEQQLAPERIDDAECTDRLRALDTLHLAPAEVYEFHEHVARRELQLGILTSAVHSERQLQASLCEFWRDHFSLSLAKGECAWLATSFERDALRPHALGRFRELLRAVLLHPAMLWYLDGRLNRADQGRPNENHARELLELHTLGLGGGYTQRDVQELARALSGWTSRALGATRKGSVQFDLRRHDSGAKSALGAALPAGLGEDEVERVIDLVCAHEATPRHIAHKLCVRYLDDEPGESAVARVAMELAHSGGELGAGLRALAGLDEFRASRGAKLKRPLHMVASSLRACEANLAPRPAMLEHLERMGHSPYQWPTPDGYPASARHWRDGLLWRWRFAEELARGALDGARVDAAAVLARAGGRDAFAALALGCAPSDAERAAWSAGDEAEVLAAILASPRFQRC